MNDLLNNPAAFWTAIVALGYPILTLVVAELQRRTAGRSDDVYKVLRLVQVTVLPALAIYILMSHVAGFTETSASLKIVQTVVAITMINVTLAALNVAMRSAVATADWLARTPGLLLDLIRLFLVLVGAAFVASDIWSVDLGALLTALGVGSVVIGLALQDTLSGLFAGVSIMSGRQFKEGDWLAAGDHEGFIIGMDWRSVTIVTEENSIIVIPNSELSGSAFEVQGSQGRTVAEELIVSFPYHVSPSKAFAAIAQTAQATDEILKQPPFEIELVGHSSEAMQYELMFHTVNKETCFKAHSAFLRKLWYVCQRNGIELAGQTNRMFRPSTVNASPDNSRKQAVLLQGGLLEPGSAGFDKLAAAARYEIYDQGEILLQNGGDFSNIHFVVSGVMSVQVSRHGLVRVVQQLEEGELFLTRAFLTNAPAPAALVAETELAVLTISRQHMLDYLNANTGLSGRFERVIDRTEEALGSAGPKLALVTMAT
jgi:small-conductance mechanosensitive channel